MVLQNALNLRKFVNLSCPIHDFTTASTFWATVNWTDMLRDIREHPDLYQCEIIVEWTNDTAGATNYIRLFDQFNVTDTAGELTETFASGEEGTYKITRTSTPFDLFDNDLTSYMPQIKVSAGTMTVRKLEFNLTLSKSGVSVTASTRRHMNALGLRVLDVISSMDTLRNKTSDVDRVLIDMDDYPAGAKALLYVCSGCAGDGTDSLTATMYEEDGTLVTGSATTLSGIGGSTWGIESTPYFSSIVPFNLPSGLNSYYFIITSAQTTVYVSKIEVVIVA